MKTNILHVTVTVKSATCVQASLSYCDYLPIMLMVVGRNSIKLTVQIMIPSGFVFFFFNRTWELPLKIMNMCSNSAKGNFIWVANTRDSLRMLLNEEKSAVFSLVPSPALLFPPL